MVVQVLMRAGGGANLGYKRWRRRTSGEEEKRGGGGGCREWRAAAAQVPSPTSLVVFVPGSIWLEQETGVSFLPEHLRLLLLESKWAEAEAYVAGPVDLADCSWMASLIVSRIRVFGVMSKFAAGEASSVSDALIRCAEAHLLAHPELHGARRVLHSMRSDPYKASKLYTRLHRGAVEAIMKWVAKCPELKSKIRPPPPCPFDRTYFISFGPRFWDRRRRGKKNKAGRRIPAHTLARCFMRKRPPRRLVLSSLDISCALAIAVQQPRLEGEHAHAGRNGGEF